MREPEKTQARCTASYYAVPLVQKRFLETVKIDFQNNNNVAFCPKQVGIG
jgi:hypothetical protein